MISAGAAELEVLTATVPPSATAGGDSTAPRVSGDGRSVVFLSDAANLTTNLGTRGFRQVFVWAAATGVNQLVSVNRAGLAGNGSAEDAAVSRDARWVAFTSRASDLVEGDTNGVADVFLRDLVEGRTMLVSEAAGGGSADGASGSPFLTSDGRYIAFESRAANLVADDTNGRSDVFVWDRVSRATRRLSTPSTDPAVAAFPGGTSEGAILAEDGGTAVFWSSAWNLAPGITRNGFVHRVDLYVRRPTDGPVATVDLLPETITVAEPVLVSVGAYDLSADGRFLAVLSEPSHRAVGSAGFHWVDLGTGAARRIEVSGRLVEPDRDADLVGPLLSEDGQTVVFETVGTASSSVSWTNRIVYAWDATRGEVTRVSSGGWLGTEPAIESPSGKLLGASRDGDFVAFVGGDTNEPPVEMAGGRLMVRRRSTGELRRIPWIPEAGRSMDTEVLALSFSGDGKRLAFQTRDAGLVADDRNGACDVFFYDWDAGQLRLVSAAARPSSTGPGMEYLRGRALSADGRWLVFESSRPGWTADTDTNQTFDVFLRDGVTGTNRVVSLNASGTATGQGTSLGGVLSADGRWVAFTSWAPDLVADDGNRRPEVFLWDRETGRTVLVNRQPDGSVPTSSDSLRPAISPDGRHVAFDSTSPGLVPNDTNRRSDVFLYDRETGRVGRLSELADGLSGNADSMRPAITPDGRWVVFESLASNLVGDLPPLLRRVYAREIGTGRLRLLFPAGIADSQRPPTSGPVAVFSPDGGWVAFVARPAEGPQLVLHEFARDESAVIRAPADEPSLSEGARRIAFVTPPGRFGAPRQVWVHERGTGRDELVSVGWQGEPGSGSSFSPAISADGRHVVFVSAADNLVPGDVNALGDIFLRDLELGRTIRLSTGLGGSPSEGISKSPMIGRDGRTVVFGSFAGNLVADDANRSADLYFARLPGPESDFRVTSIQRSGAGEVVLLWPANAGQTYRVEYRGEVDSGAWLDLGVLISAEGGQGRAVDRSGQGARRFYRVVRVP